MKYDKQIYYKYLLSDKWKQIRHIIAERDNYTCTRCNKVCENKNSLFVFQVHHKNYKFIFREEENLDCLRFLCESCHNSITAKNKKIMASNKRKKLKRRLKNKKQRLKRSKK